MDWAGISKTGQRIHAKLPLTSGASSAYRVSREALVLVCSGDSHSVGTTPQTQACEERRWWEGQASPYRVCGLEARVSSYCLEAWSPSKLFFLKKITTTGHIPICGPLQKSVQIRLILQ